MTMCDYCHQAYHSTESCTFRYVQLEGAVYEREGVYALGQAFERVVAAPTDQTGHCDDCGVALGLIHHDGCTLEKCPRCHELLASCGCNGGELLYEKTS